MPISDEVKDLTKNIQAAHEMRTAAVADIRKETHQTLEDFKEKRKRMASDLRQSLASDREERTRIANDLRQSLASEKQERASQVKRTGTRNNHEFRKMGRNTDEFLSTAERGRKETFATLKGEIKEELTAIAQDVAQTLADYREDRQEMAASLKEELAEHQRKLRSTVADLRSDIAIEQKNRRTSVEHLLADSAADHRQAHANWESLAKARSSRQKTSRRAQ